MICIIAMVVLVYKMLGHIRSNKRFYANFIGPLIFFLPSFFDEQGNVYRHRFLIIAALAGILGLLKAFRG